MKTYMNTLKYDKNLLHEIRQFINDLFVKNSGENMKFVERIQFILEPKSHEFKIKRHFLIEEAFSYKYSDLVKSINKQISECKYANHCLLRYFKPESVIQVGQKLDSLSDLEKLNVVGKNSKLNIEEGKIYLIYVWSVYKPICKKQLSYLNQIYEEHNYDNNAVFVSINTDKNREYASKLIRLLHCDHLENLYIDESKYPNHPLITVANKYGYPASILVNNDGMIELSGSLFDINLEEKIESLLKRENAKKEENKFLNKDEIKEVKNIAKGFQGKLNENFRDLNAKHLYGANLKIKYIYTAKSYNDFISESGRKKIDKKICAVLNYYAHEDDMNDFDYIFEEINNFNKIDVVRNVVETYEIHCDKNPICSMCNDFCINKYAEYMETMNEINNYVKSHNNNNNNNNNNNQIEEEKNSELNNNINIINNNENNKINEEEESDEDLFEGNYFYGYFVCPHCKQNYCIRCGNYISDINFVQKIHKHFLFYITFNNREFAKYILSYNITTNFDRDFKYFYENSKTEKIVDIASHFMVKCDACLEFPIRPVRWKCANCVSKNICDKCKSKIENKENGYKDLIWKLTHEGCDPHQHVFMKILFDCFAY